MTDAIQHHPDATVLTAYVAGRLPEGFALVVATHVSLCDACRAELGALEAVGGAVLDAEPSAPLDEASFAATLARIGRQPDRPRPRPKPGLLPDPLRDYVGGDLDAVCWRALGGGVKQALLPAAPGARVRLLSIPGGAAMPDHGHGGLELTLVLKGAFRDEFARFARGDLEVANEADQHTPVAEPGEACICLAASDAPLRFRAVLPRLLQPFFRI